MLVRHWVCFPSSLNCSLLCLKTLTRAYCGECCGHRTVHIRLIVRQLHIIVRIILVECHFPRTREEWDFAQKMCKCVTETGGHAYPRPFKDWFRRTIFRFASSHHEEERDVRCIEMSDVLLHPFTSILRMHR